VRLGERKLRGRKNRERLVFQLIKKKEYFVKIKKYLQSLIFDNFEK
jgi:sugar diacid utilization regulator